MKDLNCWCLFAPMILLHHLCFRCHTECANFWSPCPPTRSPISRRANSFRFALRPYLHRVPLRAPSEITGCPEEVKKLKNLSRPRNHSEGARGIYMDECAQCHGEHGKGDGPEPYARSSSSDIRRRHRTRSLDGEILPNSEAKPMPRSRNGDRDQRWGLFSSLFSAPSHCRSRIKA